MAIKLGATGITFQDNSVQTTAGGPVTTQYAIGSYVFGRPQNTSTTYNNTTIAGSSLYAGSYQYGWQNESGTIWYPYYPSTGSGMVASLVNTGSWRCVSVSSGGINVGGGNYLAISGLWVRYA